MPLKFKFYYAASLYLLLWGSALVLFVAYTFVTEEFGGQDFEWASLFLTIIILLLYKTALSIKAIRFYNKTILPSTLQKRLFIAGFCYIILFSVGISLLCLLLIVPEDFLRTREYYSTVRVRQLFLDISFFVANIAAIYLAIFDLILLKAIRIKQRDNLLSFEFEGVEEP